MESFISAKEAATLKLPPHTGEKRLALPYPLRKKLQHKRRLQKRWADFRDPNTKRELNKISEELSAEIAAFRGRSWENYMDSIGEDGTLGALYRLTRRLTRTPQPIHPLVDRAGTKFYSPQDRADLLGIHLRGQFMPYPAIDTQFNKRIVQTVRQFLNGPNPEPLPGHFFISPAEVERAVLRLKPKKAPGPDGITNHHLTQLPRKAIVALTKLFNGVLRTGHFPTAWKRGKVIMLPKPGKDKRQPGSYRPITLLPHPAKLFERLFLRRLKSYVEIRPEQFGFREGHSTTLQLVRVLHHMASELNAGRSTVGVFLDIEKAFDRVWHSGLVFKLLDSPVPPMATRLVASFLNNRHFHVAVEGKVSVEHPIYAGVPQGSCLSPALYALFTNDIPTLSGQLYGEDDVVLALFADDSAYLTSHKNPILAAEKMQRMLDVLPSWLDRWRMSVNVGKTSALLVTRRRRRPPNLELWGQEVEWADSIKYLGCTINRSLSMSPMATQAINKAKAARAMLRPVLKSTLPLRVKVSVYKTFVRPHLTYAAPAWHQLLSATNKTRLQRQQNISLRMATGAPWFVRNKTISDDVKIEPLAEFVERLARRMYDRADNGPHEHLRGIAPLHARPPNGRPTPRELLGGEYSPNPTPPPP